jgi:hypothetical protein
MTLAKRLFFGSVFAVITTVFLLSGTPRMAHAQLSRGSQSPVLVGDLTTRQVECPTLCTQGVMTGGLAGRLDFVMETMTPTDDPNVFLYTGTNKVTTPTGTLAGTDHGIWNIATGEFVDFTIFSTATGAYRNKRGTFTITGIFDPVIGQGHSKYVAVLFR